MRTETYGCDSLVVDDQYCSKLGSLLDSRSTAVDSVSPFDLLGSTVQSGR